MYYSFFPTLPRSFAYRLPLLVGLLLLLAAPSQAQSWSWLRFSAGAGDEYGQRTAVDAAGNVYVAGFFSGVLTTSSSVGSPTATSAGSYDGFIAKYAPDGTPQWVVRAGGTSDDRVQDMAVDAAGNVYLLTNYLSASAAFGATTLTNSSGGVFNDICVAKLNTSGVWQWAVKAGGSSADTGSGIAVDGAGNVVVTGLFQGTASFGALSQTSAGNYDAFVAKLNGSGAWQWAIRAGGSSSDGGKAVTTDVAGNLYVTGYFGASVAFGATTLINTGASSDVFVGKVSPAGVWQWAKSAGGAGTDTPADIALDGANNVFLTGTFTSAATFGAVSLPNAGAQDVFVTKLNSSGTWQWATGTGGTSPDGTTALAVDAMGDVYVTGYFNSPTIAFGGTTLTNVGSTDAFTASLTSAGGTWQWVGKGLYGASTESHYGLCVDALGVLYVTGNINSNPFTIGNGTTGGDLPGNTLFGGVAMYVGKIYAPPTITSFSPSSGPVGTSVAITGANFTSANFVTFNGVYTTTITVNSATSITATVPVGANLNAKPRPIKVNTLNAGSGASLTSFTVTGAVTVLADSVAAPPGTLITVPVRVRGFQSMTALQGTLAFDATRLTFAGVAQLGLPGMAAGNFGAGPGGKLTFAWNNPTNAATSVADNSVVFAVKFTVGALTPGSSVPLDFANAPLAMLVLKSDFTAATCVTKSGKAQAPAGSAALSGGAFTSTGTPIPGVRLSCPPLPGAQDVTTTANGAFSFTNLVATGSYALLPGKANDVTVSNGLTVLDLALMQRHVLGVTLLGSAYKAVAADVDRSSSVTMTDVALTRNVLLGVAPTFPKGRLWTFVRANQLFANVNSPWPVDTFRTYSSVASALGQDFIGCKLGDVDDSWNSAIPRPAPGSGSVGLTVADAQVQPGQRFTVPVTLYDFHRISALQLTTSWDPTTLRLVGVADGDLPGVELNQALAYMGLLPLVWTDAAGASQSRSAGAVLAYLMFEATGPAGRTAIQLTDDVLPRQAYDQELVQRPLTVSEGTVTIGQRPLGWSTARSLSDDLRLTPNPARETVQVSQASGAEALLFDALGRLVLTQPITSGVATLPLRGLPAGVYTVRTGPATRQLVVQ